jgi:outer membrane protein insertion porin family
VSEGALVGVGTTWGGAWRAAWVAGVAVAAAAAATAQPQPGTPPAAAAPRIAAIEVEGARHVPADQVRQWLGLRAGDRFDPGRVSRAVRELASKRRFDDVRVEGETGPDGIVLHVVVREYPQIEDLRIEGTDAVDVKDIRAAMRLTAGSFVTPAELRADRDKILALYRDKGHFRATVTDSLAGDPTARPTLVLRIVEGPKVKVQKVAFVGNANISEKELRKQMETREDGFLRGGELKMDALQQDFETIASHYRDRGWLDAQVTSHDLDVGANGKDLVLRIHVQEGRRYSAGDVTWSGNTVFSDSLVRARVKLRKGAPFGEADYEATTTALYELYNDAGYIHFNATPRRDVHGDVVDLAYVFTEGDPATINQIRVVGNTKTQDKVILREFLILPGDTFDRSKLMRSIREVYSLGFFDDIGIQNFTPRDDGTVDLELRVAERQTGQLGAGAGYSQVNAVTGFIEVAETNFRGSGERMSFRWEFSKRQNELDFSYSKPWLFDTPTSLGIELYNSSRRLQIRDYYRDKRTGGALTLGRRLDFVDYTRASWRFRVESIELTDIDTTLAEGRTLAARYGGGARTTIGTGLTLRRDSTDNPFFPTAGSDAEASVDLVGKYLGGDESYLRTNASVAWFHRVGLSKLALMLRSRFGLLRGLDGRPTPDYELFRLGGSRYYGVRGYDDLEIVPLGNPAFLGGQAMSISTAEMVYPFGPKVHGLVFFDAGNTWNSFGEADLSFLRKGAGVGVRVEVPMLGQLGLDYGYGFDRVDALGRDDDGWQLHFNFGRLF